MPPRFGPEVLYPDDNGELGRKAGDDRGEGMLRGMVERGTRTGDSPLEGAVFEDCVPVAVGKMFAALVVLMQDVLG